MPTTHIQPTFSSLTIMQEIMRRAADPKEIAIVWNVDDVKRVRPQLNDEQAWAVLESVAEHHDGEAGISWATLEEHADSLFADGKEQQLQLLASNT